MIQDPYYVPLAIVEAEVITVRRCLQKFARKQLNGQGGISPETSESEITADLEASVPQIVRAIHRSPLYPRIKNQGWRKMEEHISQLIEQIL